MTNFISVAFGGLNFNSLVAVVALLLTAISTSDSQQLSISPRGTQVKTANTGVIFTCTLLDYEQTTDRQSVPTINWLGPGLSRITATKGRVYVERTDEFNLRLYITRVTDDDAGLYTCTAEVPSSARRQAAAAAAGGGGGVGEETDGEVQGDAAVLPRQRRMLTLSEETKLFLIEDIQFANTSTLERHREGSSPLLPCDVTGQPTPEVSWRFNKRRISPDGIKYVMEAGGLRIKRVDVWDNGTYECRAEVASLGNTKSRLISLEVLHPPSIIRPPVADNVIKGRDTTLRCHANGNPPPEYEWFREQKVSDMIRVKTRLAQGTDRYVIHDVSSDDEGRYICRAYNSLGNRESSVDIRMLVPPTILPVAARIVRPEGSTLSLPCEATGTPTPDVYWGRAGGAENYTEDALLNELAQSGVLSVESSPGVSTLIIRNVRRSHAVVLSCTARNAAGSESSNTTFVVEFSPSVTMVEKDQFGWPGQSRDIQCIATGRPLPSMNWYRGEQYLTDSGTFRITNERSEDSVTSTLTVSISDNQSWLYGSYSCIAKNVHGYTTETAFINEALPPDIPRNVSVLSETQTSVSLSAVTITRPSLLPVSTWLVQYVTESKATSLDEAGTRPVSRQFTNGANMTITNLSPGTSYTFSLSAGNDVGYGPPIKFRVTTLPRETPLGRNDNSQQQKGESTVAGDNLRDDTNIHYQLHPPHTRSHQQQSAADQPHSTNALRDNNNNNNDDADYDTEHNNIAKLFFGDRLTTIIVIAVGSSLLLIVAVLLSAACVLVWTRRRRSGALFNRRRSPTASAELGPPAEMYALNTLQLRRPADSSLPDRSRDEDDDTDVAMPTTTMMATPGGTRAALKRNGSSVQQLEWQRMLTQAAAEPVLSDEEVDVEVEMYNGNTGCPHLQLTLPVRTPPPPRPPPRAPTRTNTAGNSIRHGPIDPSDVVLDGYHSADNVDDDIDRIDCSIAAAAAAAETMPMNSVHNKFPVSNHVRVNYYSPTSVRR